MRRIMLAAMAVGALALGSMTPAMAQGGCGPFGHRGWDGWCHRDGWRRPVAFSGYGYGFHRPWGWHHPGWGYHHGW